MQECCWTTEKCNRKKEKKAREREKWEKQASMIFHKDEKERREYYADGQKNGHEIMPQKKNRKSKKKIYRSTQEERKPSFLLVRKKIIYISLYTKFRHTLTR